MFITSIAIIPRDIDVKADSGGEAYNDIDTSMVYSVTENLSNVIFDAYEEGELEKGRAFGTKGEHYAADYIYIYCYE